MCDRRQGRDARCDFDGFVRVTNNSGEEYEDAQVRLVVGTINLVEKIAQLAQIPMSEVEQARATSTRAGLKREAAAGRRSSRGRRRRCSGRARAAPKPKEIIKEGLSEYFIYTDRRDRNDPQRLVEADAQLRRPTTCRSRSSTATARSEYGEQLVRMYLLTNDEESKLGTTPLPDGVVRVFRDNGRDGLSYLAAAADQVHPDRRQDRAEPRPRSRSGLRAGQAPRLPRQHLAADQRHRTPSQQVGDDEPSRSR